MNLRRGLSVWLVFMGISATGCIHEVRVKGNPEVIRIHSGEVQEDATEERLKEQVEEEPGDLQAWWRLGSYYEQMNRFPEALMAYQRMQEQIEVLEEQQGRRYTGGLYLLAKVNSLLRRWPESVRYLQAILALEPKDAEKAALVQDFREAHFLLGAINYEHRQLDAAERELQAFLTLGGEDHRVAAMLVRIEDEAVAESQPESAQQP